MSSRVSFALAVGLLLIAAALRLWQITALPAGLSDDEIVNVRIMESVRAGNVEIFYDLGDAGREGIYPMALAFTTALTGSGTLGYRFLSFSIGMLTLALVYITARGLFGSAAGLSSMGLLAFAMWPNVLAREVNRETLLPLVITGVLLFLILSLPVYRRYRQRGENTTAATGLGFFMAFGLYIHPVGLLTLIFCMIFLGYMVRDQHLASRRRLSYINFSLLVMLILAMPYIISTIRNPSLGGIDRLTGENPVLSLDAMLRSLRGFFISGDMNPLHNLPGRPLFDPLSGAIIALGMVIAGINWRQPRYFMLLLLSAILSPVYLLAANAPDFTNYSAILPVLALFFGAGIRWLIERLPHKRRWLIGLLIVPLLGGNLVWVTGDLFERWPTHPALEQSRNARLGRLAAYIDRTADTMPTVICGWQTDQSPRGQELSDAQIIALLLHREANLNIRYLDCFNALLLTNGGERQRVILTNPALPEAAHPLIQAWLARGRWVRDSLLPAESVIEMNVEAELADVLGAYTRSSSIYLPPEVGGSAEVQFNTPISFGGNVTLLGYVREEPTSYQPGGIVTVITYWRIDGDVPPDLQFFHHILGDPSASPPANTDIINVDPSYLRNRDILLQISYIGLPSALRPGQYTLSLGAYQTDSDERLNVFEGGIVRGTRLFLYEIDIIE